MKRWTRAARWAVAAAVMGAVAVPPVAAQRMSEGFQFLEAVRKRDGDVVTNLLDQPGSTLVNTRDISSGETALHIAAARRDLAWVRFLAARGADPNIANKAGATPLQIAIGLGFVEGVEALLAAGAQLERPNSAGETALLIAVHRRDPALVRLLLARGANPDRADNSGRTARDHVQLLGDRSLLEELRRADAAKAARGAAQTYGPKL